MAYVALAAFFAAIGWMVWRGFQARKEYLHRGSSGDSGPHASEVSVDAFRPVSPGQGQGPELTGALAGHGARRVQGFAPQGK